MSVATLTQAHVDVVHKNLEPVILLGHGSSGTSILSRLLREHLRVSFGTESQFIIKYYHRMDHYGDLNDDANLRLLIDDLVQERWFARCKKKWGFEPDKDIIFQSVRARTFRGVLDSFFLHLAEHNDMAPRWGDKTPEYALNLPIMGELFPDAKYIHLVRDGRDVALSLLRQHFGPKHIYYAAKDWRHLVEEVDAFFETVPPHRKHELQYEELLTDPVDTFAQLIDFLEIEPREELLEVIEPLLFEQLNRSNFNKWRSQLSPASVELFERTSGSVLRRHGYESERTEDGWQPGAHRKTLWWCQNKALKYANREYWKDNLYKVGLKWQGAIRSVGRSTSLRNRA